MLNTTELINHWPQLEEETNQGYFLQILEALKKEIEQGKTIFPPVNEVFTAFKLSQQKEIKVVLLGQDPYHGKGQAHGLSFSVKEDIKLPPSLKNIFKELESDMGIKRTNGNLTDWANQGVFLLNTALTVEESKPGSHSRIGWENFTDKVIECISQGQQNVVFIFWGKHAQSKKKLIDTQKHCIISSSHPSPFSAHIDFFGSKPFTKTNKYLKKTGQAPIQW